MADKTLRVKLRGLEGADAEFNGLEARILPPNDPAEQAQLEQQGGVKVRLQATQGDHAGRDIVVKQGNIDQVDGEELVTLCVVIEGANAKVNMPTPRQIRPSKEEFQALVAKAHVAPVPALLGVPLAVIRGGPGGDNTRAARLMIDPATGAHPPSWQGGGTDKSPLADCVVVRVDGEDFTVEEWSKMFDYLGQLIEVFEDEVDREYVPEWLKPEKFAQFGADDDATVVRFF